MAADEAGGEDELIQATFAPLASGFVGALGLKDDCAVLSPEPGHDLVLTTDAIAEGVHFFSDDSAADIAWKALAVNVSDLAAKGATPVAYLMSLAFPERPSGEWLAAFATGLRDAQTAFAIALAGGDTDRRPGPMSVTITAIGSVPRDGMVRRGAAQAGDLLFVSGSLGDSALGLKLRLETSAALGLAADEAEYLIGRYLRPQPRVGLTPALRACAHAAMDVSDGLVKDCGRMARASGLAASITASALPLSAPAKSALSKQPGLLDLVLAGGDDYEVLAAVAPARAGEFRSLAEAAQVSVTEIGRLAPGTGIEVIGSDGRRLEPGRTGWDHFPPPD